MSIKLIAAILFISIVISLATALFQILRTRDSEHSAKAYKALKFRIGLSILLFLSMIVALSLGWIQPTGIGARMQHIQQTNSTEPAAPSSPAPH